MYGRCADYYHAFLLFEKMPTRTVYSWVGILTVCVDHELYEEALSLFQKLLFEEVGLEFFVFPVVLKACGGLGVLKLGKEVHGFVLKRGFLSNIYVGNALIDMYGKCRVMEEAVKVLKGMPEKDCVSWNSVITSCAANGMVFEALEILDNMQNSGEIKPNLVSWSAAIGGFAQNDYDEEALELLGRMLKSGIKPNAQTLASILPSCGRMRALTVGKEIHGYVMRHELVYNSYVVNGLIDVYRRCRDMESSGELFLRFSAKNSVSYNTMIVGYCENGNLKKAKDMFDRMKYDGVKRDTISWNSMISGYCDNGKFDKGLEVFREMQFAEGIEPDSFTIGSALACCAALAALREGREIHSYAIVRGLDLNPFIADALVDMYCRCEEFMFAELVFFNINERDTMTWNLLISGYARANQVNRSQELLHLMERDGFDPNIYTWNGLIAGCMENGHNELALQIFSQLQETELRPDIFTIGMILPVCSRLLSIEKGKQVHAYSIRCGYDTDVHIGAAIVDMYAKCGTIKLARLAFHRISQHNLVSFNTMLAGFALHGLAKEGLALFHGMMDDGIRPDAITFLSVLSLCVHGGATKEGLLYFNMMKTYQINPELKHYTCMVDLFSRAGKLREAHEFIWNMLMKPDAVVWGALLNGCVVHSDLELGEIAANRLIEQEEDNAGNYVLLANLYAATGRLKDLARTRRVIGERGIHKSPGCSWIEDRGQVHVFLASDRSHRLTDEIYATLEKLNSHMRIPGEIKDLLPDFCLEF